MKLVRFELKKIGLLKTFIVLLVLTLPLIYIYFVSFGGPELYKNSIKPAQKFYDTMRGEVTEEMYSSIEQQLNILKNGAKGAGGINEEGVLVENSPEYDNYVKGKGTYGETINDDIGILSTALSDCDEILRIQKNKQIVINNAKNNLSMLGESNIYEIRYNKMILEKAEKLSNLKLMNRNNQYDTYFMSTDYLFYLFPALIILLCGIFTKEKESGMTMLLRASREGRKKLFTAKYTAMIVTCVGVTLYFQIINFGGLCLSWGLQPEELGDSIREIRGFDSSIYDYSIIQFCLLITLIRILAVVFVGTVILLISILSKNTITSVTVSAVVVALLVGVPYYIRNLSISGGTFDIYTLAGYLKNCVCTWGLFSADYFTKFSAVNIFNFPVPDVLFVSVLCLFFCIALAISSCCVYCGKPYRNKRKGVNI